MKKIIDVKEIELPGTWIELSKDEVKLIAIERLRKTEAQKYMPVVIIKLLGLSPEKGIGIEDNTLLFNYTNKKGRKVQISGVGMLGIMERLDWITGQTGLMKTPEFEGFKSPDCRLDKFTIEQFIMLDNYFCEFLKDGTGENLNLFCNLLYTKNKRSFKVLKDLDKLVITFWYTGFKNWLKNKYPLVFRENENDDFEDAGDFKTVEDSIASIIYSLNDGRAADNELIRKGKMHEMLFELNRKIEIYEASKRK